MANIAVFSTTRNSCGSDDRNDLSGVCCRWALDSCYAKAVVKSNRSYLEKHNTRYVRSATIIDGSLLGSFCISLRRLNDIPMSTTWVFVGLLCGRELASGHFHIQEEQKFKTVFPLSRQETFMKMMVGLAASLGIVLLIHYILVPNGF